MRLIRSTAIISTFTLLSRVLGLVRDILTANFLGASLVNDAFITATKLPNLFRRMFAEGAFNAAFVPLYARRIEQDGDEAAARFAGEAFAALLYLVAIIVIIFEITMPWTLNIIGGGLDKVAAAGENSPYDLAVTYARITMPYLLMMCAAALISGMLNTHNRFAIAAFVPVLLNIVLIAVLLTLGLKGMPLQQLAIYLSLGMSGSGLLQLGLLFYGLKRANIKLPLFRPRLTPGVRRLWVLGVPGMISAGITHINIMVSHFLSTFQEGAPSWLYYADRLYQLPLGMIGIAMGVALLPALSRRLRAGDESGAMTSLNRAIEIAAYLTLPATIALAIMPDFLISGLFERGRFAPTDTLHTAKALQMFAFGLPAFVLLKVLTPAFFARENTRTPMIFAAISAVVNLVLGAILFFVLGFYGLALATTIAGWINVFYLSTSLFAQNHLILDQRLKTRLPRIFLASLLMGVFLWPAGQWAQRHLSGHIINDYSWLLLVCSLGFILYLGLAWLFKAFDIKDFRDAFRRTSPR